MNRDDFPMFKNNPNIIYLDNGATTFKPFSVLESMNNYYEYSSANAHRGDYHISHQVDEMYEGVRSKVKQFINAKREEEIIFTSGTTESLNLVIKGFFKYYLKEDDEILITKSEHASNVLPWFELADELKCQIKYIPLDEEFKVTVAAVDASITPKTKVIALAHVTNVIGDVRPIREISSLAHQHQILMVVDGAQSTPHMKIDVQELDADFFAFSAHKMCGPTGTGVLYGKYELLNQVKPLLSGGGMNGAFNSEGIYTFHDLPSKLEAGTPNIAGVIGLGGAIDYLQSVGLDNIHSHEVNLREYLVKRLETIPFINIYNKSSKSGIVTFNVNDIFSQDLSFYLDKNNICVRSGNHCAKMVQEVLGIKNTCRISFYLYNTKEDVDNLINVLSKQNIINEIL